MIPPSLEELYATVELPIAHLFREPLGILVLWVYPAGELPNAPPTITVHPTIARYRLADPRPLRANKFDMIPRSAAATVRSGLGLIWLGPAPDDVYTTLRDGTTKYLLRPNRPHYVKGLKGFNFLAVRNKNSSGRLGVQMGTPSYRAVHAPTTRWADNLRKVEGQTCRQIIISFGKRCNNDGPHISDPSAC
ncbi:hypothetical protein HC928_15075 [bacterium]|nr:hypothetical protein [bacterium]